MEFAQITANVADFFQAHQLISIVALVVVVYFLYVSPKDTLKFLLFVAVLAIAGYFALQLRSTPSTSVSTKEELTNKTKKAVGD